MRMKALVGRNTFYQHSELIKFDCFLNKDKNWYEWTILSHRNSREVLWTHLSHRNLNKLRELKWTLGNSFEPINSRELKGILGKSFTPTELKGTLRNSYEPIWTYLSLNPKRTHLNPSKLIWILRRTSGYWKETLVWEE